MKKYRFKFQTGYGKHKEATYIAEDISSAYSMLYDDFPGAKLVTLCSATQFME